MLQRQNINIQINSRFTPATDLKVGTFVFIPNFTTQKGISKKLKPLRKGPYQIIDKPTDVKYKLIDSNKKEIVQHQNNHLPYYPKEYALRELSQLYFFTGRKVVQNNSDSKQNQNIDIYSNPKPPQQKQKELNYQTPPKLDNKTPQTEIKNRKLREKFYQKNKQKKSEHRQSSPFRNQPRKDYKTFIPQSKILKKVEFPKPL